MAYVKKAKKLVTEEETVLPPVDETEEDVSEEETEEGDEVDESASSETLHPGAGSNAGTSRMETIAKTMGVLANVDKETLKYFNGMMDTHFGKSFGIPDGAKEKNQNSIDAHPSDAVGGAKPKTSEPMHHVKEAVKEEVAAMFEGQSLSEEFKEKATVLFEASVEARVNAERIALVEEYEEQLEAELEAINEKVQEQLDTYVSYVSEEWMKDNQVAIEASLRNEITTEFMTKLRELFIESNVNIPEEQVEVVDALAEKVDELEGRLAEAIEENSDLRKFKEATDINEAVTKASEGLTLTESTKFKELAAGVDADDLEDFNKKLGIIKESIKPAKTSKVDVLLEEVNEDNKALTGTEEVSIDPAMKNYLAAIKRTVKA